MAEIMTVSVLMRTPTGIICVEDREVKNRWKLVGGKNYVQARDWRDLGLTKIHDETSIILDRSALILLHEEGRPGYNYYFCEAHLTEDDLKWVRPVTLNLQDIPYNLAKEKLFEPHRQLVHKFNRFRPPT